MLVKNRCRCHKILTIFTVFYYSSCCRVSYKITAVTVVKKYIFEDNAELSRQAHITRHHLVEDKCFAPTNGIAAQNYQLPQLQQTYLLYALRMRLLNWHPKLKFGKPKFCYCFLFLFNISSVRSNLVRSDCVSVLQGKVWSIFYKYTIMSSLCLWDVFRFSFELQQLLVSSVWEWWWILLKLVLFVISGRLFVLIEYNKMAIMIRQIVGHNFQYFHLLKVQTVFNLIRSEISLTFHLCLTPRFLIQWSALICSNWVISQKFIKPNGPCLGTMVILKRVDKGQINIYVNVSFRKFSFTTVYSFKFQVKNKTT